MLLPFQRFAKYEGLGNDFVVVDVARVPGDLEKWATAVCDRHFGVGADGVLFVLPPSSEGCRARMLVINADGSRPEMCGNGLRCVALHLAIADHAPEVSYVIDTDAGPRRCEVERNGHEASVRLTMGRASIAGEHVVRHRGVEHHFLRVSTGNPHAVSFERHYELDEIDELAPIVSAAIEGGANIGFAEFRAPRSLELRVWERGVGRTLACGTGAVAAVAAACELGKVAFGESVEVHLPGGSLRVSVARDGEAALSGPARAVFSGELSGE
jgi:diaminopimelate epimerase